MRLKFASLTVLVGVGLWVLPSHAQHNGKAELWLTTADRSSLLIHQTNPLRFQRFTAKPIVIDVDDRQTYQSIDGFGFALTGGSAQLMMHMDPSRRATLLKELFGRDNGEIGVSYLRVSIGSSDMNGFMKSLALATTFPVGETDPALVKFNLGQDREDVIPVLKEILAINPSIKILGSPWTAPSWMKTNDNPKDGSLQAEALRNLRTVFC